MMRNRHNAFTLVELLVVVSIIAILIAFLLPALGKAREQAKLVECLTRIRQCGLIGMGNYAADYRGAFVPAATVRAGFPSMGYQLDAGGYFVHMIPTASPYQASWADLIQIYLDPKNQRDQAGFTEYSPMLYCASDYYNMSFPNRTGWWGSGGWREFSWRQNWSVTPILGPLYATPPYTDLVRPDIGRKVGGVKNPSQKVFFIESHYRAIGGAVWGYVQAEASMILDDKAKFIYSNWSPPRHKRGLVASFCDGSARIIPFHERAKLVLDTGAGGNGNNADYGVGPNWDLERP